MKPSIYSHPLPFHTESGKTLPNLELAYNTYGRLNKKADNVIWVCHALTGNSEAEEWWPGLIGKGKVFDSEDYFIVSVNIPASCYASTGPSSFNPQTGTPYYLSFPELTIRDVVRSLDLLRQELGIRSIDTIIGGSIGGQQALEYAIMYPHLIRNLVFIASAIKATPWSIAFNQSQRLALLADPTFKEQRPYGGQAGLKAARSIAMLSYRTDIIYNERQDERDQEKTGNFPAESYQDHQGDKLVKRFDAYSYYALTRMMDSHNIIRGRRTLSEALSRIRARILSIGISGDILFPVHEQRLLATLTGGIYREVKSDYGHDGFLVETEKLGELIRWFREEEKKELLSEENFNVSQHLSRIA